MKDWIERGEFNLADPACIIALARQVMGDIGVDLEVGVCVGRRVLLVCPPAAGARESVVASHTTAAAACGAQGGAELADWWRMAAPAAVLAAPSTPPPAVIAVLAPEMMAGHRQACGSARQHASGPDGWRSQARPDGWQKGSARCGANVSPRLASGASPALATTAAA